MAPRHGIAWSQLRIGATTGLIVLFAAFAVFFVDDMRQALAKHHSFHFYTSTAQTLRTHTPVWLAGQPAGLVSSLSFETPTEAQPGRLRVNLSVSAAARPFISEGAAVQLITAGLLGEAVVNIIPPEQPGASLAEGSEIPTARELDPSQVTLTARMVYDSLGPLAARWRQVLGEVQEGRGTLQRLMQDRPAARELRNRLHETAAVFDTLGAAARVFTELLTDRELKAAMGRVGPRLGQVAETWAAGDGSAADFASDTILNSHLAAISGRLSRLGERLDGGHGTLGRLLNDRVLAEELTKTRKMLEGLRDDLGSPTAGRGR